MGGLVTALFLASFDDDDSDNVYNKWTDWTASNTISTSYGRNDRGVRHLTNTATALGIGFGGNDTIFTGQAIYFESAVSNFTIHAFSFLEGATTHVGIRPQGSDGSFDIYRGTTLLVAEAGGTGLFNTAVWHYIEFEVIISDTVGRVIIKVDATEVYDSGASLDTKNGGTGVIDKCMWGGNSGYPTRMDDLYIFDDQGSLNNTFYGDAVVEKVIPDGAGNYTDFTPSTGSNWQNVDDGPTIDGDSTYNSAGTGGDTDSYTFAAMAAASGADIAAVQIGAIVRHEGGGGTLRLMHRRSASDTFGATKTPSSGYGWVGELMEQDPQAGPGAWTVTNVDASEFGVDIVS
jgi:hypothetical protein